MKQEESNSKLCIIPYIPGYAEYAARVRDEILKRKGSDFIIAVDLPRGLESQVIEATKKLPEASVIVDRLNRGIPILPTSAPIEAVRSYLEYGTDLQFIDTSLPVIGNMDDYQLFANSCILHGIEEVLQKPEQFGIPEKDITKSWISSLADMNYTAPFVHSSIHCHCTNERVRTWSMLSLSPYPAAVYGDEIEGTVEGGNRCVVGLFLCSCHGDPAFHGIGLCSGRG